MSSGSGSSGPIITGGVQEGVVFGSQGDQSPGNTDGAAAPGYSWFDPIAFYCQQASVSASDCAYFCNLCRGTCVPTLVNLAELQGTAPDYPPFTAANIEALGVCQIFAQWVYSVWWSQQTGQQEQLPGAPGSGPGNGGGIGG